MECYPALAGHRDPCRRIAYTCRYFISPLTAGTTKQLITTLGRHHRIRPERWSQLNLFHVPSHVYFQEESIATVIQSCVLGVLIFPRDRAPAQMSTPSGTVSNVLAPGEYLFRMSLPVRSTIHPSQAIAHDQLADRFHTLYLRRLR